MVVFIFRSGVMKCFYHPLLWFTTVKSSSGSNKEPPRRELPSALSLAEKQMQGRASILYPKKLWATCQADMLSHIKSFPTSCCQVSTRVWCARKNWWHSQRCCILPQFRSPPYLDCSSLFLVSWPLGHTFCQHHLNASAALHEAQQSQALGPSKAMMPQPWEPTRIACPDQTGSHQSGFFALKSMRAGMRCYPRHTGNMVCVVAAVGAGAV